MRHVLDNHFRHTFQTKFHMLVQDPCQAVIEDTINIATSDQRCDVATSCQWKRLPVVGSSLSANNMCVVFTHTHNTVGSRGAGAVDKRCQAIIEAGSTYVVVETRVAW